MSELHTRLDGLTDDQRRLLERRLGRPLASSHAPVLSHAQRRFWWLHQLDPDGFAYNTHAVVEIIGDLCPAALERSFAEIVRRHSVLRTTYASPTGIPIPTLTATPMFGWDVVDLERVDASDRSSRLERLIADIVRAPFDLARGPLLRARLWRFDASTWQLAIVIHHIVSDRWSMGLLVRELAVLYDAFADGAASPLPALEHQYGDFASAQEASLRSAAGDAHAAYWRRQLAGPLVPLDLPVDRSDRRRESFAGAVVSAALPADVVNRILALAHDHNATLFMALFAAFVTLLHRYSGQSDVVVGIPMSGRREAYTQSLIGCFIDTLPLRCDVGANPSFRQLLERVRQVCVEAFSHQDLPFERIVEILNPDRRASASPFFRVMFTLNDAHDPMSGYGALNSTLGKSGLRLRTIELEQANVPSDLILHLERHDDGVTARLAYDTTLFEPSTARRIVQDFCTVVSDVAVRPDVSVSRIEVLSAAERRRRLAAAQGPLSSYPQCSIGDAFAAVAARMPKQVALVSEGEPDITYAELNRRSNQLARILMDRGVRRGDAVGIAVERSTRMIVAALAVLKTGAAYVPLDLSHPSSRRAHMLATAGASLLLTETHLEAPVPVLRIDADHLAFTGQPYDDVCVGATVDDAAYVCYTSGSTGQARGVRVPHRGVLRLVFGNAWIGLGPDQRILQLAPFAFDASTFEIWGALLHGALLVLAPNRVPSAGDLRRTISRHGITTMWLTSSMFSAVIDEAPLALQGVQRLLVGGEALSMTHVRAALRALPGLRLINGYGPTEATTFACLFDIPPDIPDSWSSIPIGYPVANSSSYVLDRGLEPPPIGVAGELYVGGDGVAMGYIAQPGATAERFVPDPFAPIPGGRLYRTGDVARVRPDGAIEFLGRRDHQVKIRGFRIELGEIESALLRHPNVREGVVRYDRDGRTIPRLVAYIAPRVDPAPDLPDLNRFLALTLPDYMLPGALIALEALPRTSSQKIDRQALAQISVADVAAAQDVDPPQGDVELGVADMWRALLGVDHVGRCESFFALGGHSILATQLASRIERRFDVPVPLRVLMEEPTIEAMARHIVERGRAAETPDAVLPAIEPDPAARHEPFPLTDIQQAYWVGRTRELPMGGVSSHGYQEIDVVDLDLARLQQGVQRLVDRHDMLRSVVDADGYQRVLLSVPPFQMPVTDLRTYSPEARDRALLALREALSHEVRPSDTWPLFGMTATRLDERRTRLHLSTDALIGDAWSWSILARELTELYRDPAAALDPIDITFRDYVTALQALKTSRLYAASEQYWRERLADLPLAPPLGRANAAPSTAPRFSRRSGTLVAAAWRRLKDIASDADVSATALLLTAFGEVLATWSGAQRFTITLTLFNRLPLHPHAGRIVGDFTSMTLVAVDRHREAFTDKAKRIQRQLWESLDHRYFSGVEVLRELGRREGAAAASLPVVFTSLLSQTLDAGPPLGETVFGITQTPQVSLDHQVYEKAGNLVFNWDVVEDLFPDGCLDQMFAAYSAVLELLAEDADARGRHTGLIPDPDRERRAAFNQTQGPIVPATLHGLFAGQAATRPDHLAVIAADRRLSYRDLDRESDRVSAQLRAAGAQPQSLVAIAMEKGWEQVVGVLGVLKAGAAYLPLDPGLPRERLWHLIHHGQVRYVLTQPAVEAAIDWPDDVRLLCVRWSDALDAPSGASPAALSWNASSTDLAYVIYTSGSTGVPKGVMIDHQGAVNTVLDLNERFAIGPADRVLALSSLSFDLSVYDMIGTLAAGGTIVMPPPGKPDPAQWAALVETHGVTVWNSVPALLELFVEYLEQRRQQTTSSLRLIMLSGDWIALSLVPRMRAMWNDAALVSLGGATEASIWSIAHPIDGLDESWRSVPYGRPLKNQTIHVLNPLLEPCPAGVSGELFIGGVGLAKGYWRDGEKTAASFITHPDTRERLYRTGDLGRHLSDMTVEFLGRADFQVKVRGHRIELGEIEAALLRHPNVRAAVVSAAGSDAATRRLVAYVVAAVPPAPDAAILRTFLRRALPQYMVPSAFVALDRLPLSANGKVDRIALPVPPPAAPSARLRAAAAPAIVDRVSALVGEVLATGAVDPQANLLELGANSVGLMRIVNALESEYGVRLKLEEIYANPTAEGFGSAIEQLTAARSAAADKAAQALAKLKRLSRDEFQARLHSTGTVA